MRALVTGGAGFIGSGLVERLLVEGHEVDTIDDLSTGTLSNLAGARGRGGGGGRFSFHRFDIRSPELVDLVARREPEVVFHFAAQADVRVSIADPAHDAGVNVIGSLHLLEGARRAGARKVVFAGSGGTLYGAPTDLPTPESHPHQPISPYGVAKKAVGDYLHYYAAVHGLDYAVLALANVYGPRQDPFGEAGVVAIFARRLLDGLPVTIYGDGNQTRDFVYVDDVVDAFARAKEPGAASGLVVNVGTGAETSVNDVYVIMARLTGTPAEAVHAPARPGEVIRSALDPRLAGTALGWKPATTLEEGLGATLDWFRSRPPAVS
ncbi:MAG: GDP-mannose 4,6-dehydratase [Actinomycetota bacterium]|nr:GDP-mannose 4,6-dehydratase [Actinomycetota bacterium]